MTTPLAALLAGLGLAVGGAALHLARRERRDRQLADVVLFGPLAITLAMALLSMAGVRCTLVAVAATVAVAGSARLGLAILRRRRERSVPAAAPLPDPPPAPNSFVSAPVLLALAAGVLAATLAARRPMSGADPAFIWATAGAQIAAQGSADPALLAEVDELQHADYPPLYRCNLAWLYLARGRFDPWIGKLLGGWFLAALLLELAAIAGHFGARRSRALVAAAFGLMPATFLAATSGLADIVVTAYLAGALAALLELESGADAGWRGALRAGLCLAGAALTKHEGLAVGAALLVLALLLRRQSGARVRRRDLAVAAAPMVVAGAAWWIAVAHAGLRNDLVATAGSVSIAAALARVGPLLRAIGALTVGAPWSELPDFSLVPWLVLLAAPIAIWLAVRQRRVAFEMVAAPAQLALYAGALLFTPHDFPWHVDTALSRLLLQCLPAAMAFVLAALTAPTTRA